MKWKSQPLGVEIRVGVGDEVRVDTGLGINRPGVWVAEHVRRKEAVSPTPHQPSPTLPPPPSNAQLPTVWEQSRSRFVEKTMDSFLQTGLTDAGRGTA